MAERQHDAFGSPTSTESWERHRTTIMKGGYGRWFPWSEAYGFLGLRPITQLVLVALASKADHSMPGNPLEVGYAYLKRCTGLKDNEAIQGHLKTLQDLGYITILVTGTGNQKSVYRVEFDKIMEDATFVRTEWLSELAVRRGLVDKPPTLIKDLQKVEEAATFLEKTTDEDEQMRVLKDAVARLRANTN